MIITLREKTIEEKEAEIELKYKSKLETYKNLIWGAMATDGASQAEKIAGFQQKYNSLLSQQNAELEALYNVD